MYSVSGGNANLNTSELRSNKSKDPFCEKLWCYLGLQWLLQCLALARPNLIVTDWNFSRWVCLAFSSHLIYSILIFIPLPDCCCFGSLPVCSCCRQGGCMGCTPQTRYCWAFADGNKWDRNTNEKWYKRRRTGVQIKNTLGKCKNE